MSNKLAMILCLLTVLIVGSLAFFANKTIDYSTIWFVLKLVIPAGFVAYVGGFYLGKILKTAKADTKILTSDTQKKYIDDLLLTPEQVFNLNSLNDADFDMQEEKKPDEKTDSESQKE